MRALRRRIAPPACLPKGAGQSPCHLRRTRHAKSERPLLTARPALPTYVNVNNINTGALVKAASAASEKENA
jgi:hypothetical protein